MRVAVQYVPLAALVGFWAGVYVERWIRGSWKKEAADARQDREEAVRAWREAAATEARSARRTEEALAQVEEWKP